ncbi:hypothetical protein SUGI_0451220 [Cryptomeria japonica]|nr:hypothetical protein SUGI_0451220 [Cryptomeria japonica]
MWHPGNSQPRKQQIAYSTAIRVRRLEFFVNILHLDLLFCRGRDSRDSSVWLIPVWNRFVFGYLRHLYIFTVNIVKIEPGTYSIPELLHEI